MNEKVIYKKNYLSEVVVRIDFFSPIEYLNKSIPDQLLNLLSNHFPVCEPTESIAQEFQFGANGSQAREIRTQQWNFFGKDREKQLSISPAFLFASYKKYEKFESISSEFKAAINALNESFPNVKVGRIGLRYINNIEIPELNSTPFKYENYIKPELLTPVNFFKDQSNISRLFHVVEFKNEDLSTTFQYGFPNPDYPAPIKRPYFVIDIDSYVQIAHELNESSKYLNLAHESVKSLFEQSIQEGLREKMNDE